MGWLRVSMSYKRFANLEQKLKGDLARKVMAGVGCREFSAEKCNCNRASLDADGVCRYGKDQCRTKAIIYQAECTDCSMVYIGSTQGNFKKRMEAHCGQVRDLVRIGKKQILLLAIGLRISRAKMSLIKGLKIFADSQ